MSIQPLPRSDKGEIDYAKWREFIIFSELLATQPDLDKLFTQVLTLLHRYFMWDIKVWLNDQICKLVNIEEIKTVSSLINDFSPLMEKASQEKRIIPDPGSFSNGMDLPDVIATPLVENNEVLALIEVVKNDRGKFSVEEIIFINGLFNQLSTSISITKLKSLSNNQNRKLDQLNTILEITHSILSNIDLNSLLNSSLSLIYQKFSLSHVYIYDAINLNNKSSKRIGISRSGLDPERQFSFENGSGPVLWCIEHHKPILINDINNDERYTSENFETDVKAVLVLPIVQADIFTGVLELCSQQVNFFDPDTIEIFNLLSKNIAIAIRNAELYRLEHIRRVIADRFRAHAGLLTVEISLDETLSRIIDEFRVYVDYDICAIWLIDTSDDDTQIEIDQISSSIRLAAFQIKENLSEDISISGPIDLKKMLIPYKQNKDDASALFIEHPWTYEVIISNTTTIREPPAEYEPLGALLGFKADYSAIAVPLVIKNQPIGILVFSHHLPSQFTNETKFVVTTIADYASNAIENVRLYSVAHDQAWISTVLLQVAEATQSISNLDELLGIIVNILPGLFGTEACAIFLWDQAIETFVYKVSNGFEMEQSARLDAWDIVPGTVTAFESLKEYKNPIVLNPDNLSEEIILHVFPDYDLEKDLLILFPLFTQNSLCGALLIDFTHSNLNINSSQELWDEKYALIQGATRQAAIAIENLQLVKSQEEEAYISVALLQVAQAIVSLSRLDDVLESIVRITPILVGIKRCIIYLWDVQESIFHQSQNYGFSKNNLEILGQEIRGNEFPFIDSIYKSNQLIIHALDKSRSPNTWKEISSAEYFMEGINTDQSDDNSMKLDVLPLNKRERLLLGFPISIKDEILGVMLIEEEDPIKGTPSVHIRERRIEIVKGITQQAAIAIKNESLKQEAVKSEIMERELHLAREIQATFLPDKMPILPGWDFDARWQPARQVGGDFYDVINISDDNLGFVIADVADKGMPAALFMTLIRTLIRAAAKEKSSPAAVLKQVNELLIPDTKNGMFVTIFYGVLSLTTGRLIYANCGHNPPILKQLDRDNFTELTRTGMALGIFSDIDISDREIIINPGGWLLLYTDGITEAFSAEGEMFGTERLFKAISQNKFSDAKGLLDVVENSVVDFINGEEFSDDITLTAIFMKS